jgi:flagellar hook-associated protein 3 FlgL
MRMSTPEFYNQGLSSMSRGMQAIYKIQAQIDANSNILTPSDNPVSASKINALESYNQKLETYAKNRINADNRLNLLENSTDSMITDMQRVTELITQARTGTLGDGERQKIALELEGKLEALYNLSNTQDANGEYVFSGNQSNTKAYAIESGKYVYQGDQGQRVVDIGANSRVAFSDTGLDVFDSVKTGNGYFETKGNAANTGTGKIGETNVLDRSALKDETYTIEFVTNGSAELAYTVTGSVSGQVVPAQPAVIPDTAPKFTPGETISVDGMSIEIEDTPIAGDSFTTVTSTNTNVMNTLKDIIDALKTDNVTAADEANMYNLLSTAASSFDNAYEVLNTYSSTIGTRSAAVAQQTAVHENLTANNELALSSLRDLDITKAVTQLNQEMIALQVAQQSFTKMQQLSIFNFM